MNSNRSDLYININNLYKYLKLIFSNLNKEVEGKVAYNTLKINPKNNFSNFIIKFRYLVEETNITKKYFKRNLFKKLFYLL